jgi:hypothetical protein
VGQPNSANNFAKWHREAFKAISWLYLCQTQIERALQEGFMKTGDHILGSEQHATRSSTKLSGPDEDLYFTIHSISLC